MIYLITVLGIISPCIILGADQQYPWTKLPKQEFPQFQQQIPPDVVIPWTNLERRHFDSDKKIEQVEGMTIHRPTEKRKEAVDIHRPTEKRKEAVDIHRPTEKRKEAVDIHRPTEKRKEA